MESEKKKFSADTIAKNEPPVAANDLLAEITPLLSDYFIGEIKLCDNGIYYSLPNGQMFILSIQAA